MGRLVRRYIRAYNITAVNKCSLPAEGTSVHYTKLNNLNAAFVIGTSPAGTDREITALEHPLGRKPAGFNVIWKNKAGDVYIGATNPTAWTSTHISVHCEAASTTVHLVVF